MMNGRRPRHADAFTRVVHELSKDMMGSKYKYVARTRVDDKKEMSKFCGRDIQREVEVKMRIYKSVRQERCVTISQHHGWDTEAR